MDSAEKMKQMTDFLQRRITTEFEYPFRVSSEGNRLLFSLRLDGSDCSAKMEVPKWLPGAAAGEACEEEMQQLFQILRTAVKTQEDIRRCGTGDYQKSAGRLILRPLNYDYVAEELADVPHFKIGDIALVLYMIFPDGSEGGNYMTAKVGRAQVQGWRRDEREVLMAALENTARLYGPRLITLEEIFDSICGKEPPEGDWLEGRLEPPLRGVILTNNLQINGAVAAFYPGTVEKIAEKLGDDVYLAFTSIHEVQIHPAAMFNPEIIGSSLRDTNRHCNQRPEILTDRVYRYSREGKRFGVMEGDRFLSLEWEMGKE